MTYSARDLLEQEMRSSGLRTLPFQIKPTGHVLGDSQCQRDDSQHQR